MGEMMLTHIAYAMTQNRKKSKSYYSKKVKTMFK